MAAVNHVSATLKSAGVCAAIALLGLLAPSMARAQAAPVDRAPTFKVDQKLAQAGEKLFTAKTCTACHTVGKGVLVGPDLNGVFERRSPEWVRTWLYDPPAVLASDAYAQALKEKYKIEMPKLGLTDDEITALMNYLAAQAKASRK